MVRYSLMGRQQISLLNFIQGGNKSNNDYKHDCGNNHMIHIDFQRENIAANVWFASINLTGQEDAKDRQQLGPEIPYCANRSMKPDNYCPWKLDYRNKNKKIRHK